MNEELLNALRYKSEGTDIDFKSAQYRFTGGSDEEKSELLKDVLALANAWRDGPGYILLGFREKRPHPAEIVGIEESIDDAKLQQFVNSKVKPKLTFKYEERLYEGKTIGVISIPKQKRPFYLANPYGKLKSNIAYVRRGSSTDEAEPTEIAAMALADAGRGEMQLELKILSPDNSPLPAQLEQGYLSFPVKLPDYESPRQSLGPYGLNLSVGMWRDNRDYWREYSEYARINSALIEMKFVLRNISVAQLTNAKLEVTVHPLDGQRFEMLAGADLPDEPQMRWSSLHIRPLPNLLERREPQLVVDDRGESPICRIRFGSLLPGEEAMSSDTLAVIPLGPGRIRLALRILGGELSVPVLEERILHADGASQSMDCDGLFELHDKAWDQKPESSGD